MSTIKLSYFDMDGGRAEPLRIALHAAGIVFEDHRISFPEFAQMRQSTPLNAVPVLEVDGTTYCQSNAMCRYYGKKAGLYPADDWEAFKCDEIMEATEDVLHKIVLTFGLEGDALKTARAKLIEDSIKRYLKFLDTRLKAAGGQYFAGGQLSVADLKVFMQTRFLSSGKLDHVPVDLISHVAPGLSKHMKGIENESIVTAYYARDKNS